jgi:uncharacterized RDD family membrane protein YckC
MDSGATMPAHNPYIAWMYEKYGRPDPTSKTIIDCFEQMATALKHQAYLLSLVIKDKLERHAKERANLGTPITAFTDDNVELVRTEILCQLLWSARRPFEQAVKDGDKATFIAEALQYHILGKVVTADGQTEGPHSPSSGSTQYATADRIGLALSRVAGYSSFFSSGDQLLRALGAQVEAVASDVVRQILYGEVPPVRRTEDFLLEPEPVPAPPSREGESQLAADPSQLAVEEATDGSAVTTRQSVCPHCGERIEPGEEVCQKCPKSNESSTTGTRFPIYASMRQRFCAYLADYVLIYFIVLCAYLISALAGSPLSSDDSAANMLALLALVVYMTIAQMSYHTTVGKYIMGIEVVNEIPDRKYPSWGRILKRETLGRFCSFLLWGAGYWTAIGHPNKQAWSDRMSGTLVVVRTTNRVISRALMAFLLIALLVDVGVTGWGYQQQEKQKRYAAVSNQLSSIGAEVETSRKEVEQLVSAQAADIEGYQRNMRQMTPWLDRYDSEVDQMQAAIRTALNEGTISSSAERQQMEKLLRLWDIRKQQSHRRRDQAQVILNYVPSPLSAKEFQSELEMIDSDINSLEQQAGQLVSEIQKK